jgi:L-malate glycosyltransferase
VVIAGDDSARTRALAVGLRERGHSVAVAPSSAAARKRGEDVPDCVITASALAGPLLRRRGAAWILDVDGETGPGSRLETRLVRAADGVACPSRAALEDIHLRIGGSLLHAPDEDLDELARYVEALAARRDPANRLRAIMLGPVNSPHVEHMALALHRRGVNLQVAGEVWGGLQPSVLPAAGVPVSCISWPFVAWFRRLLREQRPALTHAHWTPFAFQARLAGAKPLVVTPWGSDVYRAEGRYNWANRAVARWADVVVTDSQDLLDAMVDLGTPRDRTMLLNWGVDLALFSPPAEGREAVRRRLGLGPGPLVLSPRSLKSFYNPRAIVEAFARVRQTVPDAQLLLKHMSADGPPDLGELPEGVLVVGPVPYEQMADYYRAADVCVSVPDTDSSPRSVWEAMACGCPCVVSDLPWARELIEPGRDALLVPIESGAIAASVERLLTDPDLASAMAAHARSLVERHRDMNRETGRLIELYERLAETRK